METIRMETGALEIAESSQDTPAQEANKTVTTVTSTDQKESKLSRPAKLENLQAYCSMLN